MPFHFTPINFLHYFLKREANQFFTSVAIRSLALGMVLIFEPIFLFNYFNDSLPLTVLYFAAVHGLYGLLVALAAKLVSKIGLKHSILFSHFFFIGYYLILFFIYESYILLPLAILIKVVAMLLFWPAFHIDFVRFSEKGYSGRQVGKMNVIYSVPTILSPLIGGVILSIGGYPALFAAVLVVLFSSSIPMFLSKETFVAYTDTYLKSWWRIFRKENLKNTVAFTALGMEYSVNLYVWPLFMFTLAISYEAMGGIITFSLAVAALFALYMGRISDSISNRVWFLNIGSVLTSVAWVIKYFVITPFDAFLAHTLYRICRTSASIPFETFYYERASLKGGQGDEFIIYRETILNLSRFVFLSAVALFLFFIPQINIVFLVAAAASLGFMYFGIPPKFKW